MRRALLKRAAPKRGYHHGDLQRALVSTALQLVEETDVSALTLREVARRAGVTHGAPYHHFRNKEALLAVLAEEGYRALYTEQLQAVAKAGPDPAARLQAIGVAYVRFALRHSGHFRVMFRSALTDWSAYPSLLEASQLSMILTASTVGEVQRKYKVDVQRMEYILSSWATMHGLATLWVDGPLRHVLGSSDPAALEKLARGVTAFWMETLGVARKRKSSANRASSRARIERESSQ